MCLLTHTEASSRGENKLPDGFDHAEAHFNAAMGVVLAGLRQSRHAVVAVPQDFNAKTMMLLKKQSGRKRIVSSGGPVLQNA